MKLCICELHLKEWMEEVQTPETRFTSRLLPVVKPTKALLCRFRDFSGPEPGSEQNQETVIMLQVVQVEPGVRDRLSDKRN